ncbi:Uncharacterised protein [Klebsiella pneumoniae]|nr:Uncharacterised protein [Klebsiella pneumoniae]
MSVHNIIDRQAIFMRGIHFQFSTGSKCFWYIGQCNAILRAFWPCQARFNVIHIQF